MLAVQRVGARMGSLKRALSAVASDATTSASPAFPTNVTIKAPESGPLELPKGAPVWKRKPGARSQLLFERTTKEMLKNSQYLASSPYGAPKPEALHRLLKRVENDADMDMAVKALNSMNSAKTHFTPLTAVLFAEAAVRVSKPELAVETFAKHKTTGLKPTWKGFVPVIELAMKNKDAALLNTVVQTLWAAGIEGTPTDTEFAAKLLLAHVECGSLENATRLYVKVRRLAEGDEGWGNNFRGVWTLLAAAAREGANVPPALASLIRKTALADVIGPQRKSVAFARAPEGSTERPAREKLLATAQEADAALPKDGAAAATAPAPESDASATAAAPEAPAA